MARQHRITKSFRNTEQIAKACPEFYPAQIEWMCLWILEQKKAINLR